MLKLIKYIIPIAALLFIAYAFFISPTSGFNLVVVFVIPCLIIIRIIKMMFGNKKNKF